MIAFSGAYPGAPDQIYVMDDQGGQMVCVTARYPRTAYRQLWWLPGQQQLLVAAYAPYER